MMHYAACSVRRSDPGEWSYVIRLEAKDGSSFELVMSVENLDEVSFVIGQHLDEMVAEAERQGLAASPAPDTLNRPR